MARVTNVDIRNSKCCCGKCRGFRRNVCDCKGDSLNSRQALIEFSSWEEREEFLDWLQEEGIKKLKEFYNNPGKEVSFIFRGSNSYKYMEDCGLRAHLKLKDNSGICFWGINKDFVVGGE